MYIFVHQPATRPCFFTKNLRMPCNQCKYASQSCWSGVLKVTGEAVDILLLLCGHWAIRRYVSVLSGSDSNAACDKKKK